jgi:single-strand DNA-binding protein
MLRVTLLGNLGADAETRFTAKGTQIVQFRVAVNQVRTGPEGERQENTEWFRVRISNRQPEFVQRLARGARVLVIGRLDIGHYLSKEGESRTSYDVWADDVQALSRPMMGGDAESMLEGEPETAEPVGAGVSSLTTARAGAIANANGNGKAARSAPRGESPGGAASEDLEDLPF